MSKRICSVCKQEIESRSAKTCDNCGSLMCSDCYKNFNGNCTCTSLKDAKNIEII